MFKVTHISSARPGCLPGRPASILRDRIPQHHGFAANWFALGFLKTLDCGTHESRRPWVKPNHHSWLATIQAGASLHAASGRLTRSIAPRFVQRFEEVENLGEVVGA